MDFEPGQSGQRASGGLTASAGLNTGMRIIELADFSLLWHNVAVLRTEVGQ